MTNHIVFLVTMAVHITHCPVIKRKQQLRSANEFHGVEYTSSATIVCVFKVDKDFERMLAFIQTDLSTDTQEDIHCKCSCR